MGRKPGLRSSRRTLLLLVALSALSLLFTACANAGNQEDTANNATSSAASSSLSSDCESGPEATSSSCQAAGPGRTVSADRCPDTSPTPLSGGVIEGAFGPWCENAIATSYPAVNTETLIPEGAEAEMVIGETDMDTTVDLQVQGFASNQAYTVMLHDGVCPENPGDLGPEYVHEGSGDNPSAGVVLDFTTESDGSASATATVPFLVPDQAAGKSFAVHNADMDVVGCLRVP
ncbi:hypothetical protein ITX31_02555 [Arthrobacter gandavensis]|uniref:hypothetical protein n=1 Tax=Arthrobacter gandavensis TaxID=169960 RepID=UPI0018909267|nr:hypothetical protein [Arthrobacter gandavensis]MBF4992992.1 hypothetical protein [Arthrobacter gandavensis]